MSGFILRNSLVCLDILCSLLYVQLIHPQIYKNIKCKRPCRRYFVTLQPQ